MTWSTVSLTAESWKRVLPGFGVPNVERNISSHFPVRAERFVGGAQPVLFSETGGGLRGLSDRGGARTRRSLDGDVHDTEDVEAILLAPPGAVGEAEPGSMGDGSRNDG